MGRLAEQLVVALHQGTVVGGRDTPDNDMVRDVARRCNRRHSNSSNNTETYSGPIPLGLKGQDAAAAAAAWLADAENLPKWHQIRRAQSSSSSTSVASSSDERMDSKCDEDVEEDRHDDVFPLARSQNAHHFAVLKDLRLQRQATNDKVEHEDDVLKERLHESRRRYFDLRVAHDALLRKLRKYQSGSGNMSVLGGKATLDVHSNARRRLLSSKRRAKSGIM